MGQIALVFASNPDAIQLGIVDAQGLITIQVNVTAAPGEDEILIDSGFNVDIQNATITDMSLSLDNVAITVDVNATSRLLLVNTITGESQLVSDPKYAAFDPDLGYGVLMFSAFQNLDPVNASEKYSDREIYIHDLSTNLTKPLTADELDQWAPMVLEDHYVYQQLDEDGVISVEVQPKEPKLQPYASNVLKIGVILAITLVFINVVQKQKESNKTSRHDSELVS